MYIKTEPLTLPKTNCSSQQNSGHVAEGNAHPLHTAHSKETAEPGSVQEGGEEESLQRNHGLRKGKRINHGWTFVVRKGSLGEWDIHGAGVERGADIGPAQCHGNLFAGETGGQRRSHDGDLMERGREEGGEERERGGGRERGRRERGGRW